MAIADITKPMALDETLQSTNTALGLLAKDVTVSAISTALGLLGKDTSIQAITTALGLLNKDATMVTQNSKLDTIIAKLQGIIEALGVDTSIYKAAGNKACAELTSSLLVAGNLGNVYNITDNGTTTADFVEGAGKPIHLGDNVAVVDIGTGGSHVYKFDLLSGLVDLSNYIQKSETAGLMKNDGTIDETPYTVVEASETNGNIVIDDVETPVYRNYANNTVLSTDKSPYLNRQCLTPTGFSSYVREKLIGCSVAWNQQAKTALTYATVINNVTCTPNADESLTLNGTTNTSGALAGTYNQISVIAGHKYLLFAIGAAVTKGITVYTNIGGNISSNYILRTSETSGNFTLSLRSDNNKAYSNDKVWVCCIDLTLAFGSSVADTLYAMTNNGGIDWLRNHNYPIDQYTQYGYGLYSSKPSAKKVVGFNVWDEEWEAGGINVSTGANETDNRIRSKNPIPVLPNTSYYCKDVAWVLEYDASGNYLGIYVGGNTVFTTSANTRYLKFKSGSGITTYANNITVNISDTNKNGTYEPYSCTTYSLGSTELRGHLIVQNGEIVAEGDVRESNGNVQRNYTEPINLGNLTWTYYSGSGRMAATLPSGVNTGSHVEGLCSKYVNIHGGWSDLVDKSFAINAGAISILDTSYTDADVFKTAMDGIYLICEKATPTTEQSTPFADPMSLNGCTTEEYVDDRTIPVPVGHETQYMGQSEDVVEIPSGSLSDGKRKFVAETSGGKTQYYFESDEYNDGGDSVDLISYNSSNNKYVFLNDGYLRIDTTDSLVAGFIRAVLQGANDRTICNEYLYLSNAGERHALFVRKGMKCYYTAIPTGVNFKFVPLI